MDWSDIRRVPVATATTAPSGRTNAHVVGQSACLLVDPADRTGDLDAALADRDVCHVALTHHHPDHTGAVADYAREWDLTVWARAGRESAFEAATGIAPDRTFGPGGTLPVVGGVEVLDTPGHAPEHVAFRTGDVLLSGDLALASGSVVVGAPEGDMRAYLSSLRRVAARNPARLYPGHGPVVDDPRATCRRLLAHRRDREHRVLAAVQAGRESPGEIVEFAYDRDVSGLVALARATVVAHLEKLAVEGRVRWDGTRASPGARRRG